MTKIVNTKGKKVNNYIDKEIFTNDVIEYNTLAQEAEDAGKPVPKIPDKIGVSILKMAYGLGSKYNFSGYTYVDEMIDEAIIASINAIRKFNPEKSLNAFAYFTTVMWFAFLNKIKEEKKEQDKKHNMFIDPTYEFYDHDEDNLNYSDHVSKDDAIDYYYSGR